MLLKTLPTLLALGCSLLQSVDARPRLVARQTGMQLFLGQLTTYSPTGGPGLPLAVNGSSVTLGGNAATAGVEVRFDHCSQEYMQLNTTASHDYGHLHVVSNVTYCLGVQRPLGPHDVASVPLTTHLCELTNDDYQTLITWKYDSPSKAGQPGMLSIVTTPGGKAPALGFTVEPSRAVAITNTPVPLRLQLNNPTAVNKTS